MKNFQEAENLTQEDKMKLWHDGKRGFNFKTATPEKLRTNYKICKKLGFKAECKLLSDELKKRGLKIVGKDLDSVKESRSLKEGSLYSAESLAEKIDEIATACGDFYFDTYCGGVNAQDPDEIRDELDDYIADVLRSGEFILPTKAFDNEAEWNKFVRAATDAAWECIYFNYDTAKEQVAMNESRRSKRKSLHERGMTEYGVSHADEIYRDNYEREQEKSGDKYIVRPRTQATNRYLTGEFGVRDSYALSFGTLRDLVRTCVNSNDDIELYETGDDYYFKDDGRIYDVLGFINGSLNESLRNNKKLKESKLSAEQLAKKIDEIAEACGDYYFDTYCGGIAAVDPDEIRDELDEYIIDTTHSGEFVSPHDFPYGKGYSNFCIAAKEAAWECIYFNYDVAKDQVAMNEEYEEEFDESLVKEFFKQKMKEYRVDLNGRKDAYNSYGDRPLR